jgi:hypothetical protein
LPLHLQRNSFIAKRIDSSFFLEPSSLCVFELYQLQAPATPASFVDFSNLAVLAGAAQSQNLEMDQAYSPWHLAATCSQGVALGWYKAAPSALKPQNNVDL